MLGTNCSWHRSVHLLHPIFSSDGSSHRAVRRTALLLREMCAGALMRPYCRLAAVALCAKTKAPGRCNMQSEVNKQRSTVLIGRTAPEEPEVDHGRAQCFRATELPRFRTQGASRSAMR